MKTSEVEAALDEMGYENNTNSVTGMDMPVSIPCGLSCNQPATYTEEAFEVELEKKGMSTLDTHSRQKENGQFFVDCDVYIPENYKRIKVKIWQESVRLYPREDAPTLGELAQITSAIESAFDTQLSHDPIERNND